MPARRTTRILDPRTADEALLTGKRHRDVLVQLLAQAPIGSPEYRAASAALDALDGLAGALTGNRELWWARVPVEPR